MITEKQLMKEIPYDGAYSTYKVIGVKIDDLIGALNTINPDLCVGNGEITEHGIQFVIFGETPDLLEEITKILHCRGFADEGAWYGEAWFCAFRNGKEYDGFSAKWNDDSPSRRDWDYDDPEDVSDDEVDWDAFVLVTDNASGEIFYTGDGCITKDQLDYWAEIVENH